MTVLLLLSFGTYWRLDGRARGGTYVFKISYRNCLMFQRRIPVDKLYVRSGFSSQQGISGYMIKYSSRQNKW
ncbi:hypothetical protein ES319_A12G155100v1 [Gossypium barbadense]|uniref:Secreted protein n=2 Tax=Gossypium TaxID=3633 RepID=A0A5J5TAR4_GOSBA|nr:hypothetical protein ES319_A12G155100v1 [Gossypium barbadense]TYG90283.1 hypothetical protein ES288_A12G169200v1 [Gossypium darwinii]